MHDIAHDLRLVEEIVNNKIDLKSIQHKNFFAHFRQLFLIDLKMGAFLSHSAVNKTFEKNQQYINEMNRLKVLRFYTKY